MQEIARGVNREGDRIVVRMAALVGMGENHRDAPFLEQGREPSREVGEVEGGLLVRHAEADERLRPDPGKPHSSLKFPPSCGGIGVRRRKAVSLAVLHIARRAVGDVDEGRVSKTRKLRAAADRFVVRMGDDDGDVLGRNRILPGQKRQETGFRASGMDQGVIGSRTERSANRSKRLLPDRTGRARRSGGPSRRRTRRTPPATCGGLVWCGAMPRCSGVKQKVTVTSKSASASICRSNQSSAFGRKLSAHDSPVRR